MLNILADEGQLSSVEWVEENNVIDKLNYKKLHETNSKSPIWQSSGHSYSVNKQASRRILVIGDSFVWGSGHINANNIWWRQLERELIRRGYDDVEVVAAGLNGASTQDQLEWFTELNLLETVNPDVVIVGYVTNDPIVKDAHGEPYVKSASLTKEKDTILKMFYPLITKHLTEIRNKKKEAINVDIYSYETWELKILDEPNFTHYKKIVKKLSDYVAVQNIPWFFITLPNSPDKEFFQPRYEPIEFLFNENNLNFFNLLDEFVELYGKESNFFQEGLFTSQVGIWGINPANGHPGTVSTRFYAQKTVDILEQQAPQVLAKKNQHKEYFPGINDWMPSDIDVKKISERQWKFVYPANNAMTLNMPMKKDHIVLSFELPVAINKISLEGENLFAAEMWFNSVSPKSGTSLKNDNPLGLKKGSKVSWSLVENLKHEHINSIKLSADITAEETYSDEIKIVTDKILSWQAESNAYYILLPELIHESDHWYNKYRSAWLLYEDGILLSGGAHAKLGDVLLLGDGRWSHWQDKLIFSSSDNSDPRVNGKKYEFKKVSTDERELVLSIDFDDVAVRP